MATDDMVAAVLGLMEQQGQELVAQLAVGITGTPCRRRPPHPHSPLWRCRHPFPPRCHSFLCCLASVARRLAALRCRRHLLLHDIANGAVSFRDIYSGALRPFLLPDVSEVLHGTLEAGLVHTGPDLHLA